jgi:hypothetical protein
VTPAVVLDGDCDRLLDPAAVAEIFGPDASGGPITTPLFSHEGDLVAGSRTLGGFMCVWGTPDRSRQVYAYTFPAGSVAPSVQEKYRGLTCGLSEYCRASRMVGDVWVSLAVLPGADQGDEEVSSQAQSLADLVFDRMTPNLVGARGVAEPRQQSWWTLGDCASLEPIVDSAVGMPLESGFPGDAVPDGAAWDTIVAAGLARWCPWYSFGEGTSALVEVLVQSGIGYPDTVEDATEIAVAGADVAWYRAADYQEGDYTVLAMTGPNRILVRYSARGGADVDESTVAALTAQLIAALG